MFTLNLTITSWNWLICISHQVSSITKTGINGKGKTLNHDVGTIFTKLKRGRTPKKPLEWGMQKEGEETNKRK